MTRTNALRQWVKKAIRADEAAKQAMKAAGTAAGKAEMAAHDHPDPETAAAADEARQAYHRADHARQETKNATGEACLFLVFTETAEREGQAGGYTPQQNAHKCREAAKRAFKYSGETVAANETAQFNLRKAETRAEITNPADFASTEEMQKIRQAHDQAINDYWSRTLEKERQEIRRKIYIQAGPTLRKPTAAKQAAEEASEAAREARRQADRARETVNDPEENPDQFSIGGADDAADIATEAERQAEAASQAATRGDTEAANEAADWSEIAQRAARDTWQHVEKTRLVAIEQAHKAKDAAREAREAANGTENKDSKYFLFDRAGEINPDEHTFRGIEEAKEAASLAEYYAQEAAEAVTRGDILTAHKAAEKANQQKLHAQETPQRTHARREKQRA